MFFIETGKIQTQEQIIGRKNVTCSDGRICQIIVKRPSPGKGCIKFENIHGLKCNYPCSRTNCIAKFVFDETCEEDLCEEKTKSTLKILGNKFELAEIIIIACLIATMFVIIIATLLLYYNPRLYRYERFPSPETRRRDREERENLLGEMGMGVEETASRSGSEIRLKPILKKRPTIRPPPPPPSTPDMRADRIKFNEIINEPAGI